MGGPGAGQHTKMVNQVGQGAARLPPAATLSGLPHPHCQILIASNMVGVVEGLLYARK